MDSRKKEKGNYKRRLLIFAVFGIFALMVNGMAEEELENEGVFKDTGTADRGAAYSPVQPAAIGSYDALIVLNGMDAPVIRGTDTSGITVLSNTKEIAVSSSGKQYRVIGSSEGWAFDILPGSETELILGGASMAHSSNSPVMVRANAALTLIIADGTYNTLACTAAAAHAWSAGITIPSGAALTIAGEVLETGYLQVQGGYAAAGIGGGANTNAGTIHIKSGNIIAAGNDNAAGIGGGRSGNGGYITIEGGNIDAAGGSAGAGIGGGQNGGSGDIKISGGAVKASGGGNASGIGTGSSGSGGSLVFISGTILAGKNSEQITVNPTPTNGSENGSQPLYLTEVRVRDKSGPLDSVQISVQGLGGGYTYQAETDQNGAAYIWLPAGEQDIQAQIDGYTADKRAEISQDNQTRAEIFFDIFGDPKQNLNMNVNFVNGDFEEPDIFDQDFYTGLEQGKDFYYTYERILPLKAQIIHMDHISGWNTKPTDPAHEGAWTSYLIEFQRDGFDYEGKIDTVYTVDGSKQYAELNALVPGTLYQAVDTQPGQKLYYEYYHRGRDGTDEMNFYLYNEETETEDDSNRIISSASGTDWTRYYGVYTVPENQTRTVFAFQAVSSTGGVSSAGNYLDAIKLQSPSFLEIDKKASTSGSGYAQKGEIVTYMVTVTNTGETDSSRTVFTDYLPEGLVYMADSAAIDGTTAGSLADYDEDERMLRINIGTGAAAGTVPEAGGKIPINGQVVVTFDALITGEGMKPGDEIANQCRVSYNDAGYEEFNNYTDEYNVSNAEIFVMKETALSGTLWVDKNNDGIIASGERRAEQLQVILTDSSGNILDDVNGNPLSAAADSSGNYYFSKIPSGVWQIRVRHSGYQTSAVTGNGTDENKAVNGGTDYSVIETADFSMLDSAGVFKLEQENQNFGILPILTIEKTAVFEGSTEHTGTETEPVRIQPGEELTYIIRIKNLASDNRDVVESVEVKDIIPPGLTPETSGLEPASGTISGQTVSWSGVSIFGGEEQEYRVLVKLESGYQLNYKEYVNQAALNAVERAEQLKSDKTYHYSIETGGFTLMKKLGSAAKQEETFVFRIAYRRNAFNDNAERYFYTVVTVKKGQKEAAEFLGELEPGYYTVTEVDNNWNYQILNIGLKEQRVVLLTSEEATVMYENMIRDINYTGGRDSAVNLMKDQ